MLTFTFFPQSVPKLFLALLIVYVSCGPAISMPAFGTGMSSTTRPSTLSSPSQSGTGMSTLSSGFNSPGSVVSGFATGRFPNLSSSSGILGSPESAILSCSPMDTRPACLNGVRGAAGSSTIPDLPLEENDDAEGEVATIVKEKGEIKGQNRTVRAQNAHEPPSVQPSNLSDTSMHTRTRREQVYATTSVLSHVQSMNRGSKGTTNTVIRHDSTILT